MKSLSLNAKIGLVVMIFVAACVLIATVAITKMAQVDDVMSRLVRINIQRLILAQEIQGFGRVAVIEEKNFVLEETEEKMREIGKNIQQLSIQFFEKVDAYHKLASVEGKESINKVSETFKQWLETNAELQKLSLQNKKAEAEAITRGKSRDLRLKLEEQINGIVALNIKQKEEEAKLADEAYEDAKTMMFLSGILAVGLGIAVAFAILRALSKAIDQVISNLNDSSAQVTTAAQQIASSSEELSQATTEQASSLEETSSAVEEMNSMVKKNADTASQSTSLSQTSAESATRGKRVVEEMIRSIAEIDAANNDIMKQTNESNQQISEIVKVIAEIGNKTKVINEIVFQTKLLSFNASVEAARAGEHGKGFAVVAEEVGNLAQMSGNAAKEITSMLDSSIQKVENIVNSTKLSIEKLISQSKSKVENGTQIAQSCGEVLEEIVGNVEQVSQMSQSISTASDEQSRGVSEITRAIAQLDQVTQQNASASQETASAAEELSAQAENMRGVVETLIYTIKGANSNSNLGLSGLSKSPISRNKTTALATPAGKNSNGRVIHLGNQKAKSESEPQINSNRLKLAVGGDLVPSENDPRFKEI